MDSYGLPALYDLGSWGLLSTNTEDVDATDILTFSPDGSRIAANTLEHDSLLLWDTALKAPICSLRHPVAVPGSKIIGFSESGQNLLLAMYLVSSPADRLWLYAYHAPSLEEIDEAETRTARDHATWRP